MVISRDEDARLSENLERITNPAISYVDRGEMAWWMLHGEGERHRPFRPRLAEAAITILLTETTYEAVKFREQ